MKLGLGTAGLLLVIFYIFCTAQSIVIHFRSTHLSSDRDKEEEPQLCKKYSCDIQYDESSQKWLEPRLEIRAKGYDIWQRLHSTDIRNLKSASGNRSVVLLGDSISEGWARPYFNLKALRLDPEYEHGPIPSDGQLAEGTVPFAIGGDRIQDLGYRLFELGGMDALRALAPKTIILTIGTNDFGQEEDVMVAVKERQILAKQLQSALPSDTPVPTSCSRLRCHVADCHARGNRRRFGTSAIRHTSSKRSSVMY
eukprot:gnl/MRDRNA2_/MRDRNA2_36161_c0_seq1.p1 gnl/MRDRNA2_/MRDRNA2_36161_c0~~gnl/MRDRNA2_/MRDRNA2_36161_c0_seq1.p1  ORF type:complete len:253 (+),score=31.45 gnl/MRDRNA2_/MRDRNA2_36161_c0_seq1:126-884(+)